LDGDGRTAFSDLCRGIHDEGKWPEDYGTSELIPLEKKRNAVKGEEHRTISLIPHASIVLFRILADRIEEKAKTGLATT